MSSAGASAASVPLGAKIALVAIGLGGMVGVLWALDLLPAVGIVLAGAVVVGLLLLGYRALLIWRRSSRSTPFVRKLLDGGRKGPAQHQVEDLRRKFAEGIETFKRHGKDVYSLPWYLVVGEPGSGKTEAIRHSDVKFPKGLQNKLQGTGGTVNMHWWFTFHAVLLDTAGRLLFDSSSEWPDFLKLLKTARPHAPVNGMLLFIPADRLIRDTDVELDKKAEQIAGQMVKIQQALGVRFPVFVIVSKADLINGFREFFESINDPGLQHQMMGWSNPEPIDAPYRGELIDDHFRTLTDRLRRRRLGLMMDPQVSIDPDGRPLDRLDSLFAFPESVTRLAPRLRRYLDEVFTGDWSNRPPMLRGIYFTSSMREGAELDADLASALGVPVDALPGGRAWRKKDKAYFLRDVFMEKVFRERGLVTPSSNAKRTHAVRRGLVYGASLLTAVLLVGLTAWGAMDYQRRVGSHAAAWRDAAALAEIDPQTGNAAGAIIAPAEGSERNFSYHGGLEVVFGGRRVPRAEVPGLLLASANSPITPPALLEMIRKSDPALDEGRRVAAREYVASAVLRPALEAAASALRADANSTQARWTDSAADSLRALIELERVTTAPPLKTWATEHFARLPRHALESEDPDRVRDFVEADSVRLADAIAMAFSDDEAAARAAAWSSVEERRTVLRAAIEWAGRSARSSVSGPSCDTDECRRLIQTIVRMERLRRSAYETLEREVVGNTLEAGLTSAETSLAEAAKLAEEARALLGTPAGERLRRAVAAWKNTASGARGRIASIQDWVELNHPAGSPLDEAQRKAQEQAVGLGGVALDDGQGRSVTFTPEQFESSIARIDFGDVGGAVAAALEAARAKYVDFKNAGITAVDFRRSLGSHMDRARDDTIP